jgi:hypothetical protein
MSLLLLELGVVFTNRAILLLDDLDSDEFIRVVWVRHTLVVLRLLKGELLHVINLVLLLQLRHNLSTIEAGGCKLELRVGKDLSVVGEMAAWLHSGVLGELGLFLCLLASLNSLLAILHLLFDA